MLVQGTLAAAGPVRDWIRYVVVSLAFAAEKGRSVK